MEIFRRVFLSKYLGLMFRYFFTLTGMFLVGHGIATPEQVDAAAAEAMTGVEAFLRSPEFQEVVGWIMTSVGVAAAWVKAKFIDAKNEKKLLDLGIAPVKH